MRTLRNEQIRRELREAERRIEELRQELLLREPIRLEYLRRAEEAEAQNRVLLQELKALR
jgi:hypothetical protein